MLTMRHTRHTGLRPGLLRAIPWLPIPWLLGSLSAFGCGSDDDLPKQYLGDSTDTSSVVRESSEPSGGGPVPDDTWGCLGQTPQPLPAPGAVPVAFVLPVVEWTTIAALAGRGLTATLCPSVLFDCTNPVAPPYVVQDRMLGTFALPPSAAGIPAPEGFDGFIKFDVMLPDDAPADQYFLPTNYFLPGPISGDLSQGPTVLMLTRGNRAIMLQQSFPELDPASALAAMVIARVYDCRGQPATDARVEIAVAGQEREGVVRFLVPRSRIPIQVPAGEPLVTGTSEMVGFLGVAPGTVQLRAFRRGETEPFATTEIGAVAGQISVGVLRPASFRSANISGYAPLEPARSY